MKDPTPWDWQIQRGIHRKLPLTSVFRVYGQYNQCYWNCCIVCPEGIDAGYTKISKTRISMARENENEIFTNEIPNEDNQLTPKAAMQPARIVSAVYLQQLQSVRESPQSVEEEVLLSYCCSDGVVVMSSHQSLSDAMMSGDCCWHQDLTTVFELWWSHNHV